MTWFGPMDAGLVALGIVLGMERERVCLMQLLSIMLCLLL